jgi:hypothetical protein
MREKEEAEPRYSGACERCPTCGQPVDSLRCEMPDCNYIAEWEGWHRGGGMVRKINVCEQHKSALIGAKAEGR